MITRLKLYFLKSFYLYNLLNLSFYFDLKWNSLFEISISCCKDIMIETIELKRMPSFFRVKMSAELKKNAD